MGLFDFFHKHHHKKGDTLLFGRYIFKDEKDVRPIEWIVLDDKNDELLMLSKYCLDVIHYCDHTIPLDQSCIFWENSQLRKWLNGEFFNQVFTEKERQRIVETVIVTDEALDPALHRNQLFILSQSQIEELLPNSEKRCGFPTPYARQRGAGAGIDTQNEAVWWWIMPVADNFSPALFYPAIVNYNGQVLYHSRLIASPGSFHTTVRPAIKIRK